MHTRNDHHDATIQAATDTYPPEPLTLRLDQIRVLRTIGARCPALAAAGWHEVIYVAGLPARSCRALVTVDWIAQALGWFDGFPHNVALAAASHDRPFAAAGPVVQHDPAPVDPAPAAEPPTLPVDAEREAKKARAREAHRQASREYRARQKLKLQAATAARPALPPAPGACWWLSQPDAVTRQLRA